MDKSREVIVVGGGPVGLLSALDLAWRDVPVTVLERRSDADPAHPRCNTTSARTMEFLRRLGFSERYRQAGLPPEYPTDVIYMTRINGIEITRLRLPGSGDRFENDRIAHDSGWNSVERPHRSSQMFLERVLRAQAGAHPLIDIRFEHEVAGVTQHDGRVEVAFVNTASGVKGVLESRFVMACDGGRSAIRRQLGIRMDGGTTGIGRVQSVLFRSPEVIDCFSVRPGWMNWVINRDVFGNIIPIDGRELWLTHCMIPEGEEGVTAEQVDLQIKQTLGREVAYEVIEIEPWVFSRVVAERYREGNVFLAGDAAHAWPPYAGHGMNSGIEDGMTLSWMLAAVLKGWAPETLLDAYEAERRAAGLKISAAAEGMATAQHQITQDPQLKMRTEAPGEEGAAVRRKIRNLLLDCDSQQFNAEGLNFGLQYDRSPVICYDDGPPAPPFSVAEYHPSTTPGCRAPHFAFVETGEPLVDRLGKDFSLLVSDDEVDISGIVAAAERCGMPLTVIDIAHEPRGQRYYDHALVLVRPDQRIAWRSQTAPEDPAAIIARVRGDCSNSSIQPVSRSEP